MEIIYNKGEKSGMNMRKIFISMALVTMVCSWAFAETSVWKVKKGKSVMYLGGTCHILRPADFPLPGEFDKAYNESQVLIFETDIGKIQDSATQMEIMSKSVYTDGSTIDSRLSAETYTLLSDYCTKNGIPLEAYKQLKVSMLMMNLTLIEIMKIGATPEGVDKFYYDLAVKDKKTIKGFETVDEQIDFVVNLGEGNEDALVANTLREIKNTRRDFEALITAWKTGDDKKMSALLVNEFKKEFPKIYKEFLVDRNNSWLPAILKYLKTPEKEFVLVGMAHLVGPDGIIAALKDKGYYKVQKL